MTARRRPDDRLATVATFAMFAGALAYAFILSALASDGSAGMGSWPVPGDPANVTGWRLSGGASTVAADEEGWRVVAPATGRVALFGAPVRATGGGVRLDATGDPSGSALPVLECFGEPNEPDGYEISFGEGMVRVVGGGLDVTEPFAGSDGTSVAAAITCTLGPDGGSVTVSHPDSDAGRVELTDPDPPAPGPIALRLEASSSVTFAALEMTATRS